MADEPQEKKTASSPEPAPATARKSAARKPRKSVSPKKKTAAKSAKTAKKPARRRRTGRQLREDEMEKELTFEIEHLRSLACQVTTRYLEGLESEIVQIREAVAASRGTKGRLTRLEAMLREFEGLKIKPEKGRRKDLQRISELAALLNRLGQKI